MADILPVQGTPFNANDFTDVDLVAPVTGEPDISRPFDVVYDSNNGFFFTQGAAISPPPSGAPGPLGQGNGVVRFIANGSTTAQLVNDGLTNAAGIDAFDGDGDGTASVLFSESIATNGRILRREVDTANIDSSVAPLETDNGLTSPLFVYIVSETTPSLIAMINYNGGPANGILRFYVGN